MSKNDFQKFDDDQLKAFLQKNQPLPPPPKGSLLPELLAKLGLVRPERRHRAPMVAFAGAMAAGVLAFVLVTRTPNEVQDKQGEAMQEIVDSEWSDSSLYEDELPTLDVGSDYFELVAAK